MTIIELAGPAGSGKTTLTKALSQYDSKIQIGVFPNLSDIKYLPFFAWNGGLSFSTLLALYHDKNHGFFTSLSRKFKLHHSLPARELASVAILRGWPQELRATSRTNGSIIMLDQGPVHMLCELLRYSPPHFRNTASRWWRRVCNDWGNVLDMVICLDAPDAILVDRVRARETRHQIKQNYDDWATQFLARSREARTEVLNSMTEKGARIKVIELDTSHASLSETVQRISAYINK